MYVMHAVAEGAYFDCHLLSHNVLAQQHNRPQVRCAAAAEDCFVLIWGLPRLLSNVLHQLNAVLATAKFKQHMPARPANLLSSVFGHCADAGRQGQAIHGHRVC